MLLPALSKARARAKSAVCISNLKQIGTGILLYLDNYNGSFDYTSWHSHTSYYPRSVVVCPAHPPYSYTPSKYVAGSETGRPSGTYGFRHVNHFLDVYRSFPVNARFQMATRLVMAPSYYWILADSSATTLTGGNAIYNRGQYYMIRGEQSLNGKIHFRHPGNTANMLFLDGHSESVTVERFRETLQKSFAGTNPNPASVPGGFVNLPNRHWWVLKSDYTVYDVDF